IGLEIEQLKLEYEKLLKEIAEFEKILGDKNAMKKVIIKDLEAIKKEYGYERKTEIVDADAAVYEEEKVKEQEVVFLMDRFGYAKLIEPAAYERNVETIDADNKYVLRCMNTDRICIFTQTGMVHQLKVLKVPMKKPKDKGIPIDNLCNYSSSKEDILQICPLLNLKMHMMLFTTKKGMMKFVDASEFDISRQTAAATKLNDKDEVVSIELFDASSQKVFKTPVYEEEESIAITGGSDDGFNEFFDPDDQLTFEFIDINDGTTSEEVLLDEDEEPKEAEAGPQEEAAFTTNKMAVLQTKDGVFLRFKLSEIPSKHKGAVGVRGIRLNKDDEIDKVYIVGFGDKTSIQYHNKEVELMKLKLAKRDTRGTKLRQ
ncbi:MAG: DNA topoisomerase, partial [Parasporobacterium sp.]|nr:DNA topoisomerase [Parasporobacterium sp.]